MYVRVCDYVLRVYEQYGIRHCHREQIIASTTHWRFIRGLNPESRPFVLRPVVSRQLPRLTNFTQITQSHGHGKYIHQRYTHVDTVFETSAVPETSHAHKCGKTQGHARKHTSTQPDSFRQRYIGLYVYGNFQDSTRTNYSFDKRATTSATRNLWSPTNHELTYPNERSDVTS